MVRSMIHRNLCVALFGAAALLATGCSDDDGDNGRQRNNNTNNVTQDMNNGADMAPDQGGDDDMDMGGEPDQPDMTPDMPEELPTVDEALGEVGTLFVKALCAQVFQCPERSAEVGVLLGRYPNQQACEADTFLREQFFAEGLDETRDAIAAGRQTFNAEQAQGCLDAIEAALSADVCNGFEVFEDSTPAACEDVFVGQVASDSNCGSSEDCSGDLYCEFIADQCYGTCQPEPAGGELCGSVSCAATEYCDYENDSGSPLCADKAALGERCDASDACQGEALCDINYDDTDPNGEYVGTCKTRGSVAAAGECFSDQVCARGLRCDGESRTCAAPDLKQQGQTCVFPDEQCAPGLVCTDLTLGAGGATGQCAPAKAEGGECYIFIECAPGLQCEGADLGAQIKGSCKPLRPLGAACNDDIECDSFACTDSLCVASDSMICEIP